MVASLFLLFFVLFVFFLFFALKLSEDRGDVHCLAMRFFAAQKHDKTKSFGRLVLHRERPVAMLTQVSTAGLTVPMPASPRHCVIGLRESSDRTPREN